MNFLYVNRIFYKRILSIFLLLIIFYLYFYSFTLLLVTTMSKTNNLFLEYLNNTSPDIMIVYYDFSPTDLYNFTTHFDWCCVKNYGYFFIVNQNIGYNITFGKKPLTIISEFVPPIEAVPFDELKGSVIFVARQDPGIEIPEHVNVTVFCSDKVIVRQYRVIYLSYNDLTERDRKILDFIGYNYKYYFILPLSRFESFVTYWTIRGCTSETPVLISELRDDSEKPVTTPMIIRLYRDLEIKSLGVRAWKEPYFNAVTLYNELLISLFIYLSINFIISFIFIVIIIRSYKKYVRPGFCRYIRLLKTMGVPPRRLRMSFLVFSIIFAILYYVQGSIFLRNMSINLLNSDSYSMYLYYLSVFYVWFVFLLGMLPLGFGLLDVERRC